MYDPITAMIIAIFRTLFADAYRLGALMADMADDDPEEAAEAAQELGERGVTEAVPVLLSALGAATGDDGATVDLRQDIVRALGRIGDPRALEALEAIAAHDPDRGVRDEAETALGLLRDR